MTEEQLRKRLQELINLKNKILLTGNKYDLDLLNECDSQINEILECLDEDIA